MELRFTNAARADMVEEGIHRIEVEAVLASPDAVDPGDVMSRYGARIAIARLSCASSRTRIRSSS